jgi:hypothetical protein
MKKTRLLKLALPLLSTTLLTGCWRMGPENVAPDRFGYASAVGDSWKEQMLLNLVKLRYGDVPVFLDVQAMISQYTLSGTVTINGGWSSNSLVKTPWSWLANISGNTQYMDKPTITYIPLSGAKFGRSLMTPIPPSAVLSLLQSGYPAKTILRLSINSINGLQNMFSLQAKSTPVDDRYFRALDIFADLQRNNGISVQVKLVPQSKDTQTILKLNPEGNPSLEGETAELRQLLGLESGISEYPLVYGAVPTKKNEIAILTRSMLDVLTDLSGYVEVPAKDAKERRTFSAQPAQQAAGRPLPSLLRVRSDSDNDEPLVLIEYRGRKFWIDNRDIDSKLTFTSLMFLFTLVESDDKSGVPSVVIPTN